MAAPPAASAVALPSVLVAPDAESRRRENRRINRRRSAVGHLARLPLYLLGLTMLAPFYWMLISAFKPVPELSRNPPTWIVEHPTTNGFYDPNWSPAEPRPEHVQGLLQRWPDVPLHFWRFVVNSVFISTAITIGSLLLASLAAYALTKLDLPGRRVIFVVVVASMMVPWQVTLIPNFLTVQQLGWLNSYQGYIVPALAKAFVVFFLVQYLRSVPDELVHAARVDGAGEFRIWWRVVLPLLRPALAAMAIFVVLNEWNNFLWPLIIIRDPSLYNLPVALASINSSYNNNPQLQAVIMSAALITSLPTVAFFLIFQKHFTRGIALTGLKG